ncbi:MAG TPA: ABC transporter permease, partial [Verrucomicrobiae bacterium]|nr:ABC transporter permease [Verrucomicrobiae bacterium]
MLDNIRSAFASIWGNKVRSLLTMLGVVIGVTSVTTLVAMGQGLKNDVASLVDGLGTNIVAVTAGKIDTSGGQQANPAAFISGDVLTRADVEGIRKLEGVASVAPLGLIPGSVKVGEKAAAPTIAGTDANFLETVDILTVKEGRMFAADDRGVALLSKGVAEQLFDQGTALNQQVTIGTATFTVIGITEEKST